MYVYNKQNYVLCYKKKTAYLLRWPANLAVGTGAEEELLRQNATGRP